MKAKIKPVFLDSKAKNGNYLKQMREFERGCQHKQGSIEHVWGVTSQGSEDSDLWSTNDIEITYNSETGRYYLGVETIYSWDYIDDDERRKEKAYVLFLYRKLRAWMINNHYNIGQRSSLLEVFGLDNPMVDGFKSIPELFAYFRILVTGFCSEVEPNAS